MNTKNNDIVFFQLSMLIEYSKSMDEEKKMKWMERKTMSEVTPFQNYFSILILAIK